MKLYEVPRHTKVRLISEERGPIAGVPPVVGNMYQFSHIDGMYSYCKDELGRVVHLPGWSEVEICQ